LIDVEEAFEIVFNLVSVRLVNMLHSDGRHMEIPRGGRGKLPGLRRFPALNTFRNGLCVGRAVSVHLRFLEFDPLAATRAF
jgi:hypothetical protein